MTIQTGADYTLTPTAKRSAFWRSDRYRNQIFTALSRYWSSDQWYMRAQGGKVFVVQSASVLPLWKAKAIQEGRA